MMMMMMHAPHWRQHPSVPWMWTPWACADARFSWKRCCCRFRVCFDYEKTSESEKNIWFEPASRRKQPELWGLSESGGRVWMLKQSAQMWLMLSPLRRTHSACTQSNKNLYRAGYSGGGNSLLMTWWPHSAKQNEIYHLQPCCQITDYMINNEGLI